MKKDVYRIETARLVIRGWAPEDAPVVKQAEDESRRHLSSFMIWAARGPEALDDVVAKLRVFRAALDRGSDYMYGAFDRVSGAMVGGCGLHERVGAGGIEIGYWVHPDWTRRGLATEMAGALTRVAFDVGGVRFVEIRCAKTNTSSAGVPKALGFTHEATLRERLELPDGTYDDVLVFTLLGKEYAASPARATLVEHAGDAANRTLL